VLLVRPLVGLRRSTSEERGAARIGCGVRKKLNFLLILKSFVINIDVLLVENQVHQLLKQNLSLMLQLYLLTAIVVKQNLSLTLLFFLAQ
ncbi:unnamed protein product, partial [Callosobruchus maculatus]